MLEIRDLEARMKTVTAFGDFSTLDFTMVGLGEPRVVRAGVVGGSYFDVMGLKPVVGRLIGPSDDGPQAAGAIVLTHRFWSNALANDPTVIGKVVRLGERSATIIGVVEPSVPYPSQTEIIANNSTYGTRQSNKKDGDGGGAIYGCRSSLGNEPCVKAVNLKGGHAFEFTTVGAEGGRIETGNATGAPFTTSS